MPERHARTRGLHRLACAMAMICLACQAFTYAGANAAPAKQALATGPAAGNPRWRILVLIYSLTNLSYTDSRGDLHRVAAAMTRRERERAADATARFFERDVPVLTSGLMRPLLTIRYPNRALTHLTTFDYCGQWPSEMDTTPERDPAFDSVIVIWDSSGIDLTTGLSVDLQFCSGLAQQMGAAQTYIAIQVDSVRPDQRNVFKHEWGHSILFYYEAAGTAPHPAVDNHINESDHRYVHCRTGEAYILEDESDENPIPNSIYNNETGFSHDYYSGTTARPEAPDRCLGITPEAWASGGPVTKPAPTPAGANGLPRAPTRTDPGTILIPSTGRPRRDAINRQASLPALPSLPAIPCPECCNKPNPAPCRPAGWSDCAGRPRASPPGARLPARNAHCACRP